MKLAVLTWPDPNLAKIAEPVEAMTPEIEKLIDDMIETMYASNGVGLAAPQVDKLIRLIVMDESGPDEREALQVYINPEIMEKEGSIDYEEGCLSLPQYLGKTKRFEKVTIKARNRNWEEITVTLDEFASIIVQHEMDHLEGKTIINYAGPLKRSLYQKKVKKWLQE